MAKSIYDNFGIRSVILGAGNKESELANIITDNTTADSIINLTNQTSLSEMTAIIDRARLVIGNDSGPLHVAAALPKTVIGIYGPTNPEVVGPVCQLHNVIEAGAGIPRKGRYSKKPAHNINNITVEQVLKKIKDILNKNQ